jgi:hypothetical protein
LNVGDQTWMEYRRNFDSLCNLLKAKFPRDDEHLKICFLNGLKRNTFYQDIVPKNESEPRLTLHEAIIKIEKT